MKKLKLGMHTYTLHLWGLGQNWGIVAEPRPKDINLLRLMDMALDWGLDGLHITGADLESKDDTRLEEVALAARARNLYLEYNFSLDEEFDKRLNDTFENAAYVCHKIGAELAKVSMDIRRPRPVYGSCFHPFVMKQLAKVYDDFKSALPTVEKYGVTFAFENHTETFADEVVWLVKAINHPLAKICMDTVNSFPVLEGPEAAIEKLTPYAACVHFCDHKLDRDQYGARFHGVAIGDGDIDCQKVVDLIRRVAPTDRINFEIEWDMGGDSLEDAKKKQMDACIRSIKYCRDVLKIGREDLSAAV